MILAAGLDSRAYRLAWPDGTVVFELDQPQVLEFKREVLAGSGDAPKAERREVAVDLRDDWPQALRGQRVRSARPSAWIAEGLLIYLPAAAQERAVRRHRRAGGARAATLAVEDGQGRCPRRSVRTGTRRQEQRRGTATFFTLIYNEQARAGSRVVRPIADGTAPRPDLPELLQADRPARCPDRDSEAGPMTASNSLVSATKG